MSLRESVWSLSRATPGNGVTANEIKMVQTLVQDGSIDTTQTHTLAQVASTDLRPEAKPMSKTWNAVSRVMGFFFHNAEVLNRELTALAAYRLHYAKHKNHETAVDAARDAIFDGHFDYSAANRAPVDERQCCESTDYLQAVRHEYQLCAGQECLRLGYVIATLAKRNGSKPAIHWWVFSVCTGCLPVPLVCPSLALSLPSQAHGKAMTMKYGMLKQPSETICMTTLARNGGKPLPREVSMPSLILICIAG